MSKRKLRLPAKITPDEDRILLKVSQLRLISEGHTLYKPNRVKGVHSDALFSPCRTFRYLLYRQWSYGGKGTLVYIGMNPSYADEVDNDNTVKRCMKIAMQHLYTGMFMLNAHPHVSTDPKGMIRPDDQKKLNLFAIKTVCTLFTDVVGCWGNPGGADGHGEELWKLVRQSIGPKGSFRCFKINKSKHPQHPLYISYSTPLIEFPGY